MKKLVIGAALAVAAWSAQAATYTVDAMNNSSSGGVGLASISLAAGEAFSVSSSLNDLWSAGDLPRFSDAGGLTYDRYAVAADDSGQLAGTHIGANFGSWTQNSHTAAYGMLVGEIGGQYINLGANYSGVAPTAGTLNLYYWDSNNGDNAGQITFNIAAVPEPATAVMLCAGLLVLGLAGKRKNAASDLFQR